ncbi:MAG: transcriptional regulator [Streptosporangiaceae bacterium]|nr:transcriptional regulator [Streptosporangiaceae bacterium]
MIIGGWLRERRLARGWGKAEMARRLHAAMLARSGAAPAVRSITRSLGGWEGSGRCPQDRWVAVICQVFGVELEDFPARTGGSAWPDTTAALAADDSRAWVGVARTLLERIGPGKLQPGDPLPHATDVARESGVSVPTARRGYTYLRDRGIICYRAGIGYQVSGDRVDGAHRADARSADDWFLDALRLAWGAAYRISIADGVWRAWRLDDRGEPIAAAGPRELNAAIREDHLRWLVLSQGSALAGAR